MRDTLFYYLTDLVENSYNMRGAKRKRVVVSMKERLRAIERLEIGESVKLISDEFGVGVTTVKDWRRNKNAIQDFCTQIESDERLSTIRRTINTRLIRVREWLIIALHLCLFY